MPLIGGTKYSCEPCIRGHRATHCTHTDRILIEVRKPGRPLDRCAHTISSCACSRHLKNSTVVEVKVKERSSSPVGLSSSASRNEGDDEKGDVKRLLISKEQPFARELRLSSMPHPSSTSSSSSDEEEGRRESKREGGERRKGKIIKRHRLNKSGAGKNGRESPRFTNTPMVVRMDVDGEVEPPALSPSISESGSEGTLTAFAEQEGVHDKVQEAAAWRGPTEIIPRKQKEATTNNTFRSIPISELLT